MSNVIKTALLLGVLSALLMGIGQALGGAQGVLLGFMFAVVTNFGSYWFSDKIVLSMYSAQERGPDHRLYQLVSRLAHSSGLPMPRGSITPELSPNALATRRYTDDSAVCAPH